MEMEKFGLVYLHKITYFKLCLLNDQNCPVPIGSKSSHKSIDKSRKKAYNNLYNYIQKNNYEMKS